MRGDRARVANECSECYVMSMNQFNLRAVALARNANYTAS